MNPIRLSDFNEVDQIALSNARLGGFSVALVPAEGDVRLLGLLSHGLLAASHRFVRKVKLDQIEGIDARRPSITDSQLKTAINQGLDQLEAAVRKRAA